MTEDDVTCFLFVYLFGRDCFWVINLSLQARFVSSPERLCVGPI